MARVLIIDDDSRLCDVYKEELGEEYDVVTSCSACQAIMRLGDGTLAGASDHRRGGAAEIRTHSPAPLGRLSICGCASACA